MTELTPAVDAPARFPNLLQRILGVIFSPRATYTAIAARPAILGALAVLILLNGGISYWLLGSETGQQIMVQQAEQQIRDAEAQGTSMPPEQRQATILFVQYLGIGAAVANVLFTPALVALLAAICMGVLNALYGGQASFRHVYAIVTHSWFVPALAGLVTTPLMLAKKELSSPSTVAQLLPMLPDDSFVKNLFGAIDFVWIWTLVNLATGLAVLYKRKTGPLTASLLVVYGIIALIIATVRSVF